MRTEAEGWWEQAESDLKAAQVVLEVGQYFVCAFLCQQAVEKAFKALWIQRFKEMPPKTHDLVALSEKLNVPRRLESAILRINPAYATARYPDAANGLPARAFNQEVASAHIRDAQEVFSWCRNELGLS